MSYREAIRVAIRVALRLVAPTMAPWVDFCYGSASHLIFGDTLLSSARGAQQGDPWGPGLYALAVHEDILAAAERTKEAFPDAGLDWVAFYLDDGTVAGPAPAVAFFLDEVRAAFARKGLEVNASKCEVVPAAGDDHIVPDTLMADIPRKTSGGLQAVGRPYRLQKPLRGGHG